MGLDPESTQSAKKILQDFVARGGTVFVATHTLSFAQDVCTKIGILKNGRVLVEGTLEELRHKARGEAQSLEELYLTLTH